MHNYTEDSLVEQPTIELFAELGYETRRAQHEHKGPYATTGRQKDSEVVLVPHLRTALQRLNPTLSSEIIEEAIEVLTFDRSALSPTLANREAYRLLKDGVKIRLPNKSDEGEENIATVHAIDWNIPEQNDFLLVSQFWVRGPIYRRRADLVGFVNGLPLIVIELKAAHKRLKEAFEGNIRDYKETIPQLFWYNACIILSNGRESKIGSMTAGWEHFFEWKKINNEGEQGVISLETMIRGACEKTHLLDIVENFTLFSDESGGVKKLIAKNHQFLGVNNALDAVRGLKENQGKLGVFWHTQGSGKSYSMVFFSQKVLRKLHGNWTFVIITDRDDLDGQIYRTFQHVAAITEAENEVHASSGKHLQQLLRADHRVVFTLIQKFRTEQGQTIYPILSTRSDIIVMTDEAHRTQYDTLALNMRSALPGAAFIGFTGTPLMAGDEKTKQVFGDYVSIYNFSDSVKDGTTVALYYENRTPELQLANRDFNTDMEQLLEDIDLGEKQEQLLAREFSREYHLITRDERLEKIAEDIVAHFMGRGQMGKAMVVSIDKATAIRMYDNVHKYWQRYLEDLQAQFRVEKDWDKREPLSKDINYMKSTDMAVVVSQAQNEVEEFQKKGLDIKPHRLRMVREDLEKAFKDENNPLRIVFVCAMWMTGFDVPSLSTIYLDKPMRNHTLMQTIARANRVFGDKNNGLIVDYVGIFRNLEKALAIYASTREDGEGDFPVKDKHELVLTLQQAITAASTFCTARGIDLDTILATPFKSFEHIRELESAKDKLVINDETEKHYLALAADIARLYKAILPDAAANTYTAIVAVCIELARIIHDAKEPEDISELMEDVEDLMDTSVITKNYVIRELTGPYNTQRRIDLSQIDFDALKAQFAQAHKYSEAGQLRGLINSKLKKMVRLNKNRLNYQEKFQRLIDEYNGGSFNVEVYYDKLIAFAQELKMEDQRTIAEQLTEEELTVFDLLTRPNITLSDKEKESVKMVACSLLATLKQEKLVLDWRKKQEARAQVQQAVEQALDSLPDVYNQEIYLQKCIDVYQHVYDSYYGEGKSIYADAS